MRHSYLSRTCRPAGSRSKDNVMSKVDVVGYISDAELDNKAMKVVKLAQENDCGLSLEYIRNRVTHYIMEKFYSERMWKV